VPRFVGTLGIVLVLAVIALFALSRAPIVSLGLVFPILTSAFITSSSIVVAYVSVRAYSRERLLSMLFLGCGALVFGCTSLVAAMFLGTEGRNFTATVFATGALLSGAFHLVCASLTYVGGSPKLGKGYQVSLWVPLASLSIVAVVVATFGGVLPPFYAAGSGATSLDEAALAVATAAFALSATVIFVVSHASKSLVLFWYALALGATAAGLLGIILSGGDLSALAMRAGWATLYLGGVLLVASVFSAETLSGLPSGKDGKSA
jgi:hypothetical protein